MLNITIVACSAHDEEEIREIYQTLLNTINDNEGDDRICYNLDNSNLWLCFSIINEDKINVKLTDDAEIDGSAVGDIFVNANISVSYLRDIIY